MPSLTGYGRSPPPGAYCGVAVLHGDDELPRTPLSVVPAAAAASYSDDDGRLTQRGDAMSQRLLPHAIASSSSSGSSTSSSTWRPAAPTSGAVEPRPSTATAGRGAAAAWLPCRPLPPAPPPPRTVDGSGVQGPHGGDELTAVPHVDSDRLRHVGTLGTGHFGQVERSFTQ